MMEGGCGGEGEDDPEYVHAVDGDGDRDRRGWRIRGGEAAIKFSGA